MTKNEIHQGEIVTETVIYSLNEFCLQCGTEHDMIIQLVEYGVIAPAGKAPTEWQFSLHALKRAKQALRLHQELEINLAGVALALELLDEIKLLRQKLEENAS